jgi:hypothetical protein
MIKEVFAGLRAGDLVDFDFDVFDGIDTRFMSSSQRTGLEDCELDDLSFNLIDEEDHALEPNRYSRKKKYDDDDE